MQYRLIFLVAATVLVAGCARGDGDLVDSGPAPMDAASDATAMSDAGPGCDSDAECDDGFGCNGMETCGPEGRCQPGTPPACDDSLGCTMDGCLEPFGTCVNTPDDLACSVGLVCDPDEGCTTPTPCDGDADCDDGQLCNGVETCEPAFGCRRGDLETCDDGVACTMDVCDPIGAGACTHRAVDTVCNDSNPCNGVEVCDPTAGCTMGTPTVCDDGVDCTVDACDPVMGCTATVDSTLCEDGVFCNGTETCDAVAGCIAGTAVTCDDAIGCTTGRCDATMDACVQTPDDSVCRDALACNGVETCDASGATPGTGCVAGTPLTCDDGVSCTTDTCEEPSGTCRSAGIDADRDGFGAMGCLGGMDCDDTEMTVFPGAPEICDGLDNNCNGTPDDGSEMTCVLGAPPVACVTSCGTSGSAPCTTECRRATCYAPSEICGNGCDDDGVGGIDNGCP